MQAEVVLPVVPTLRIVRSLGRGGMGAVYLAIEGGRTVAMKVIASPGDQDPASRARFQHELEAVASIRHPNVLRLVRAGEVDGVPYALFERLRGRSLARVGVLPWTVVVGLGRQIAAATAAVHAAGWIHRDLKPANVMVGDGGFATLIDFGLAKRWTTRDPASAGETGSPLTEVGMVVGTKRYLPPEVQRGHAASPASDVYALGLMLGELLDPRETVPPALEALIARATACEPERRPTAAAIAAQLETLPAVAARLGGDPGNTPPTWSHAADRRRTHVDRLGGAGGTTVATGLAA